MLGDKIKLYRENKKMTQNDIADILDVSAGTVSKYESGALEPSIKSLKRLSELFGVSIDELLNDAAVMEAYGFDWRKMSEDDCVAELMKMYQELTKTSNS